MKLSEEEKKKLIDEQAYQILSYYNIAHQRLTFKRYPIFIKSFQHVKRAFVLWHVGMIFL